MTIKPVLVPDHDAVSLRALMDSFATAAQSATPAAQANRIRQQLTESAEPGVAEDQLNELSPQTLGSYVKKASKDVEGKATDKEWHRNMWAGDYPVRGAKKEVKQKQAAIDKRQAGIGRAVDRMTKEQGVAEGSGEFNKIKTTPYKANQMLGGKDPVAFAIEVLCPDQSVVKTIQNKIGTAYQIERDDAVEGNGIGIEIISQSFEGGRTAQAAYKQILDIIKQSGGQFNNSTEVTIARQTQGVTEARPDVMRHAGDRTIKIVKRGGKPIGEIGTDAEASPGNGQYYVKLYDGSYDAVGFDTAAEALAELKAAVRQGMSEAAAPEFKPGDRVQFTSPRGAVEDGVVVKDLYPGAVEVKFDSGETRGVYANSLKPLPAAVAESIDPVEQLRADILRFAR
jgi:hypothetical protein